MNKQDKILITSNLCFHHLLIMDILLMKKEKDYVFLFGSNSILLSSMMRVR